MEDIIFQLILVALEKAAEEAIERGIELIIDKAVDEAGNTVTRILYEFDSDGDGINDSTETILTIDTIIPDLDDGYCLVNKDNQIGLGFPEYRILDGMDITAYIEDDSFTASDDGFLVDYDGDGEYDDVLVPLPYDVTGDGFNDYGWLVDIDDNGLPDAADNAPFYPVGSEEYTYLVEVVKGNSGIMDKPIDNYTVTEGLLLLITLMTSVYFLKSLFKRKDVYR